MIYRDSPFLLHAGSGDVIPTIPVDNAPSVSEVVLKEYERREETVNTKHSIKPLCFEQMRGATICHAIYALHEVDIIKELAAGHPIVLMERNETIPEDGEMVIESLCDYLTAVGILEKTDEVYRLTAIGSKMIPEYIGYYTWFIGGYGPVLFELPRLLIGESRYGENVSRYGRDVAIGSAEIGKYWVLPQVMDNLSKLNFKKVIDLGCGSAKLLIELCAEAPDCRGIGIDNSFEACQAAQENVRQAGLTERIEIIHADAEDIAKIRPETLAGTDLVTALFLVHEFLKFGIDYTVDYLRGIAQLVGTSGAIAICEVTKTATPTATDTPFVPEFQLLHDLTNQRLATRDQWREMVEAAGFDVKVCAPLGIPGGYLFIATPHKQRRRTKNGCETRLSTANSQRHTWL